MIYGPPSAGKSFVAINLLLTGARGSLFAGRFQASRPLKVAYLAGEGTSGIRDRLLVALEHHGVTEEEESRITYYDNVPQLYDGTSLLSADQFANEAKADGPYDLIIVDTLHTASVGGDENFAKDAAVMIAACQRIQRALGCALFLVHHTPKNGNGPRGSSAFPGACDAMFEIATEHGVRILKCAKLKHGRQWEPISFSLTERNESAVVSWEGAANPIKRATSDTLIHQMLEELPAEAWMSVTEIAAHSGLARQTVKDALARLESHGFVIAEKQTGRNGSRYQAQNRGERTVAKSPTGSGSGETNGREGLLGNSPRPFISIPETDGTDGANGRTRLFSERVPEEKSDEDWFGWAGNPCE
jgi:DNA-binding transcriptional ArsR family regulator